MHSPAFSDYTPRQDDCRFLPTTLFADVPPKVLQHYRQRAATEPPRELRRHSDVVRATLLAAYCHLREDITDHLWNC